MQAARRQYEPDTTCQQLVAAEAQELSKVGRNKSMNNGQRQLAVNPVTYAMPATAFG
jgi:hypothetical protein